MKTAIIVSGIFRDIENAMPTWTFDGDYFLITQDTYQQPRETFSEHSILPELEKCKDKFKAILVVDKLIEEFEYSTTLTNQTWKWKMAHSLLQPYIEKYNYERFIIIRPDSFLLIFGDVNQLKIEPNLLHSTSVITKDSMGYMFANDTWMVCGKEVFTLLSKFYDYIQPICATKSIHEHLANYLNLHNVTVTADILNHAQTAPLRPGLDYMFENNKLKDKYSVNDLYKAIWEWKKD
jgi:hypothetical protein